MEIKNGKELLNGLFVIDDNAKCGATSNVIKAHSKFWGKDIAVKYPNEEFMTSNLQDFLKECRIWVELDAHPYIIQCHFAGMIENDTPMLFLEWCNGSSLKEMIDKGTLYEGTVNEQQERILSIAIQSLIGIEYAHKNKIIHKDIKPGNIMVTAEGMAKITDFGSAAAKENSYTTEYCSPEQLLDGIATESSDVFSWAVTCIEMFKGKCGWDTGKEISTYFDTVTDSTRVPIPENFKEILKTCLSISPDDRMSSDELAVELKQEKVFENLIKNNRNLRFVNKIYPLTSSAPYYNNKAVCHISVNPFESEKIVNYFEKAINADHTFTSAIFNMNYYKWVMHLIDTRTFISEIKEKCSHDSSVIEEMKHALEYKICYKLANCYVLTNERYYPNRFSKDNKYILFRNETGDKWQVYELNGDFPIRFCNTSGMYDDYDELTQMTGIEWAESSNTDLLEEGTTRFTPLEEDVCIYFPENACFSPDGRYFVAADQNKPVSLFFTNESNGSLKLYQSKMPSAEEIMDKEMEEEIKAEKNKPVKREKKPKMSEKKRMELPLLETYETIGRSLRIMSSSFPSGNYQLINVHNYDLIEEFYGFAYIPENKKDADSYAEYCLNLARYTNYPGIFAPLTVLRHKGYVIPLYPMNNYKFLSRLNRRGFLRQELNNQEFTDFVFSLSLQLLFAVKYIRTEHLSLFIKHLCSSRIMFTDDCMQDDNKRTYHFKFFSPEDNDNPALFAAPEEQGGEITLSSFVYRWAVIMADIISKRGHNCISQKVTDNISADKIRKALSETDNRFTKDHPNFIKFLNTCINENPGDRPSIDSIIKKLKKQVPDTYEKIYRLYNEFDENIGETNFYINQFVCAISEGRYDEAEEYINKATELDELHPVAQYNSLLFRHIKHFETEEYNKKFDIILNYIDQSRVKEPSKMTLIKTIKLDKIYDENNNLIEYNFSNDDKLFSDIDGRHLLIVSEKNNLCIFIATKYGIVNKLFDTSMDIEEQTNGAKWVYENISQKGRVSPPFGSNDNYVFINDKDNFMIGMHEEDPKVNNSAVIKEIQLTSGLHCFTNHFDYEISNGFVYVDKNKIHICKLGTYVYNYLYCDYNVKLMDYDWYKTNDSLNEEKIPDSDNSNQEAEETENGRENKNDSDLGCRERIKQLAENNKALLSELLGKIKGQDHIIHTFCDAIFDAEAFARLDNENNKPLAVFTFAGPPGVGKTFLAEQAANYLELPYMRFDMTEYSTHQSHEGLIGFDFTYKDSGPGKLTSFVAENPGCVLLFDEIEKAHPNVIQLFFQILDEGVLTDKYMATYKDPDTGEIGNIDQGRVYFNNTIIIFTTNAGRSLYEGKFADNCAGVSKKTLLNALATEKDPMTGEPFFPTAIVSRLSTGYPLIFNNLKPADLIGITRNAFEKTAELLNYNYDYYISADDDIMLSLLFRHGGKSDARQVASTTGPFFRSEIKKALVKTERFDINKFRFVANFEKSSHKTEIRNLFRGDNATNILIYSSDTIYEICCSMLGDGFVIYHADSIDKARELAEQYDISMVILDISHKDNNSLMYTNIATGNTSYSAMAADEWKAANRLFGFLREKMEELPIYLLEDTTVITDSLLADFVSKGARGKLSLNSSENEPSFSDRLSEISRQLYMEKKATELSSRSNILVFDTVPRIDDDDDEITIELRNFEIKFAVDADDASSVLSDMERPDIKFKDVIGAEEAKESLKEFINYMQNPKSYTLNGKTPPKGILLHGNPGTGKTMLAKAMAGECKITFIPVNASDFVTARQGSGAASIRELFQKARRYAPSIVFIDEVDAIAKQRIGTGSDAETGLNALLAEMDGFNTNSKRPVFVIAATNYDVEERKGAIGKLDDAFMRRFDKTIKIQLPDKSERIQLLNMLLKKLKSHNVSESDVENFAERTPFISPAILTNIFQNALKKVPDGEKLSAEALDDALQSTMYGKERKRTENEMLRTARHECGHALIYKLTGFTPSYLTIVARSDVNGYMQSSDEDINSSSLDKQRLLNKIRTSLAGRAAEIVYYGREAGLGAGASSDLRNATAIAYSMITKFGMDEETGLAVWEDEAAYNSENVRKRVNEILKSELEEAIRLIEINKTKFDKLVSALVKENRLSGEKIDNILGNKLKK